MKKVRYNKIRKQLAPEEASTKISSAKTQIDNCAEAIHTWQASQPTDIIAYVISQEFGSVENAIEANKAQIEWCKMRIEDCERFL